MSKKKQNYFIITVVFTLFLLTPLFTFARGLVPCGGEGESACNIQDIFILLARVTNFLLTMAGAYAVYKIVGAGWWLTTTMGNEESITKYKKQISNAVIGFCFTMFAYMMINFVVNYALLRGVKECKVDLRNPLIYTTINQDKINACRAAHERGKKE